MIGGKGVLLRMYFEIRTFVFLPWTVGEKGPKKTVVQTFLQKNVDFFHFLRIIRFCMDTKKDDSIVECGTMAEIRRDNAIVGAKQMRKALKNDRILRAFLAKDADPAVTEPLEALCDARSVPVIWVKTMAELGRACGIDVGAAAAATVKPL